MKTRYKRAKMKHDVKVIAFISCSFLLSVLLLLGTVLLTTKRENNTGKNSHLKHENMPAILWWQDNLFPHILKAAKGTDIITVTCNQSGLSCLSTQNREILNDDSRLISVFIYGTDFRAYEAPLPRKGNHLWALFHEESPQNNYVLSHKDALNLFNFSSTFKRSSNYPITTQYIPDLNYFTSRKPVDIKEKNMMRKQGFAPVMYLQSHCDVPSDRDRYVHELGKYIDIDSYGACLNNKDFNDVNLADTSTMGDEKLYSVISKYKFHIAFENALCDDYVTEKLSRPLHLGSVPIYKGSATARDWLPDYNAIIMVDDFKTPEQLAKFLKHLDENDQEYLKYLGYKNSSLNLDTVLYNTLKHRQWSPNDHGQNHFIEGYECFLCEQMHKIQNDIQNGVSISPHIVPHSHLNCPVPKPSIGTISDVPPNDNLHRWIEEYRQSADQAQGLKNMIRDNVGDPEYLWSYIESLYEKGLGAMQHTEL